MKRALFAASLLLAAAAAFGSEELDIYTYLYRDASTAAERLGVLRSVSEAKLGGAGQLYAEALSQLLLEQPTLRTTAEREAADASARLLSGLLGDAKYAAAAGDLWRVIEIFNNPLVKADALIALGRIRAVDYLPQVVRTLSDLNLTPTSDPEAGERIAYGAILALEKYREPSGYLPVFFAATGWYNRRIKDQASSALPYIIDDPSEPLSTVIRSSTYSYEAKHLALQTAESSKASNAAKAGVAVLALGEGWRAATRDVRQQMVLSNSRKLAIDIVRRYRSPDPAVIPLLERSYKEGIDMEEKLGSVAALASIASDDAARALSSFLLVLNAKRKAGNITQEDERMVRAVIPAIGAAARPAGRPALQSVEHLDWTNAVKVLAVEALKNIP